MQRVHSVMEARSAVLISLHARILWSLQFQHRASSSPSNHPPRWWRRTAGIKTTDLSSTFGRLRWNSGSCIRVSIFVPSFIREARRLPSFVELIFSTGDERGRDDWFIEWDDFRRLVEEFVLRIGWWIETRVDWKINNLVDRLWMISTYRVTDKIPFSFVMLFVQYIRVSYICNWSSVARIEVTYPRIHCNVINDEFLKL